MIRRLNKYNKRQNKINARPKIKRRPAGDNWF